MATKHFFSSSILFSSHLKSRISAFFILYETLVARHVSVTGKMNFSPSLSLQMRQKLRIETYVECVCLSIGKVKEKRKLRFAQRETSAANPYRSEIHFYGFLWEERAQESLKAESLL